MFFTNEQLPDWTDAALTLGYPAVMSLLSLYSRSEGDEKTWLEYWICFGSIFMIDALLLGGVFSFIPAQ